MKKPENWEEAEVFTGEFETLELGGHICEIKQARCELSKTGKEMLVIMFDIAGGKNKGFYRRLYTKAVSSSPDAKWQGVYRQLTEGNSLPFFKGFIASVEKSNEGYTWNWDENTLKGKKFGGVFGQKEYLNSKGEIKLITELMFIRSVEAIVKGVEIPAVKRLEQNTGNASLYNSFGSEVITDEEIPF